MNLGYSKVVELVEWMPDNWRKERVMVLLPSPLGYYYHARYTGFVLCHVIEGTTLTLCADTVEAARACLEGLVEVVGWDYQTPASSYQAACPWMVEYMQTVGCPVHLLAVS